MEKILIERNIRKLMSTLISSSFKNIVDLQDTLAVVLEENLLLC